MAWYGNIPVLASPISVTFYFQFVNTTGSAADPTSPTYGVYEDTATDPMLSGSLTKLEDTGGVADGLYKVQLSISSGNGFEDGKSYVIRGTGTVDGETPAGIHVFRCGANPVDVIAISGDTSAADNVEAAFESGGSNTVTMRLAQLSCINSGGDAIVANSTGGNGRGVAVSGNGSGEGLRVNGGATSGVGARFLGLNGTGGTTVLGGSTHGSEHQGTGTGCGINAASGIGALAAGIRGTSLSTAGGGGPGIEGIGKGGSPGVSGDAGSGGADTGEGIRGRGGNAGGAGILGLAVATGNHGVRGVGIGAGAGSSFEGGGSSGPGMRNVGGAPNGRGVSNEGAGSGAGQRNAGGATGHGQHSVGGATSGHGYYSQALANGDGLRGEGGTTAGSAGVAGVSGVGGPGFKGTGDGAGAGAEFVGGATGGDGAKATGGSGGHGYHGVGGVTNGRGARFAGGGGNAPGLELQGVGVSPGAHLRGGATNGDGLVLEALGTGNALEAVVVGAEPLSQNIEDQLVNPVLAAIAALPSVAAISDGVWDELLGGHTTPGSAGRFLQDIFKIGRNRLKIDGTAFTMTVYDDDETTPLFVWNTKDSLGAPSTSPIFERDPV